MPSSVCGSQTSFHRGTAKARPPGEIEHAPHPRQRSPSGACPRPTHFFEVPRSVQSTIAFRTTRKSQRPHFHLLRRQAVGKSGEDRRAAGSSGTFSTADPYSA